jgi:hypothetical protein
MKRMRPVGLALLLGAAALGGCAASRPEWLRREDEACFRTRDFTQEIPRMHWGDPVRDPCWRYRGMFPDR